MDELDMKELIDDELCNVDADGSMCEHNCIGCYDIERCYSRAVNKLNHEYAESINYGGYDTAEEFWEQI